jgi:hypothetical protein
VKTAKRAPVPQACPTRAPGTAKLPIRDRAPVPLLIRARDRARVMEPKDTSLRRPSVPPKKRGAQPGESTDKNIEPCRDKLVAGYDS